MRSVFLLAMYARLAISGLLNRAAGNRNRPDGYRRREPSAHVIAQPAKTDLQRVFSDVKGLDNVTPRIVGFFQLQSQRLVPYPLAVLPEGPGELPGGPILNANPTRDVEIGRFPEALHPIDPLSRESFGEQLVRDRRIQGDRNPVFLVDEPARDPFAGYLQISRTELYLPAVDIQRQRALRDVLTDPVIVEASYGFVDRLHELTETASQPLEIRPRRALHDAARL